MVVGEAVRVAGIGCRRGVGAGAIVSAVERACATYRLETHELQGLAAPAFKTEEAALAEAALLLRLPLRFLSQTELEAKGNDGLTRSEASVKTTGLPSASEAAALAGAGEGARLLGPRVAHGPVTCAIAETRP